MGYEGTAVSVSYTTQDLGAAEEVAGMKVYNALGGADYDQATGLVHFASGVVGCRLNINHTCHSYSFLNSCG